MKVSRLLKRLSPLLLVFCYVFFTNAECTYSEDDSSEYYAFDGYIWNLKSSKWYTGKGEEVELNMKALVIEGDGGFSQGERQVQWHCKYLRSDKSDSWGKSCQYPLVPPSTIKIRMKTWDLKTLPNGEKEDPYLIADFDMEYAYYLGQNLRVESNGNTVTLSSDVLGSYATFTKGKQVSKGSWLK